MDDSFPSDAPPDSLAKRLTVTPERLSLAIPGPRVRAAEILFFALAFALSAFLYQGAGQDMANAKTPLHRLMTAASPALVIGVLLLRRHGRGARLDLDDERLTLTTRWFGLPTGNRLTLRVAEIKELGVLQTRRHSLAVVARSEHAWARFGGTLPAADVRYLQAELQRRIVASQARGARDHSTAA
jgi:hypothetical protein